MESASKTSPLCRGVAIRMAMLLITLHAHKCGGQVRASQQPRLLRWRHDLKRLVHSRRGVCSSSKPQPGFAKPIAIHES